MNRDVAVVFMLHRFNRDGSDGATSGELLRQSLRYLRESGIEVATLGDLVRTLRDGRGKRVVVFTIDDGYHDFHQVAAPIFEEFDARATVFLTTGFLDGTLWQWWDQIEWAFQNTQCREFELQGEGREKSFVWNDPGRVTAEVIERLKEVSDAERRSQMAHIFSELRVELPSEAPDRYRPMSWDQVRVLAERGFEFAPHTVNHPILSRVDDAQAREEITRSTHRCAEVLGSKASTFCYPDGTAQAIGEREKRIVAELGFEGAVVALPGYVSLQGEPDLFGLRRFSFPTELEDVVQIVSGLERIKRWLRREQ
ncbi:MAG: polysaccharide deacetylase family protein [Myxococcota bacterium]